jgi:electron transfer flavoprotein alpha subunit
MRNIAVLVDCVSGVIDESAWELATAARLTEAASVTAIVLGADLDAVTPELTRWFDEVVAIDHELLRIPDGEVSAAVLAPLMQKRAPFCILAAQSNHSMDYLPSLAVRLGRPMLTDCISVELGGDAVRAVRPVYGGKLHQRAAAAASSAGYLVTMRPGATRPGPCPEVEGALQNESIPDGLTPRRRLIETVSGDTAEVDISQAERLVAVGRGIEEEEDLDMVRDLAAALGAELGCSRPIVDKQWLAKSRQVGTSGRSVKPDLYLALGISGSFQHIGGIKGDPFVVAVNKDHRAPIFAMADVGIVADLYDIVPALTERIRSEKG